MDAGSMDKIRDILFGNQVRDFERRFVRMEDQLAATIQELRDETRKRLDALELFFKEEMTALKERLKDESAQRQQDDQSLSDALKTTASTLNKTIAHNNDLFAERATELRQQILDQSKQLSADIQTRHEQASRELKQMAGSLEDAKVDRSVLAEYLIQMAMSLSNQADGTVAEKTPA